MKIMKKLRKKINKLIKKYSIRGKYLNDSYSQYGEDLIASAFINEDGKGFYVDVGAHHPVRYSNSYRLYRLGWRGINIDSKPGTKKIFDEKRPRDINIEIGVGNSEEVLTYYMFNDSALNSFSPEVVKIYEKHSSFYLVGTKQIKIKPLEKILDEYLPKGEEIDVLNVDVEGLDYEVLQSNNWQKYRPKIIICEISAGEDFDFKSVLNSECYKFLNDKGYELVAKNKHTMFFALS